MVAHSLGAEGDKKKTIGETIKKNLDVSGVSQSLEAEGKKR